MSEPQVVLCIVMMALCMPTHWTDYSLNRSLNLTVRLRLNTHEVLDDC